MTTSKITVILSSAALGPNAGEADFNAWHTWVCDHIDEALGFEVAQVDQGAFGKAGEDSVNGATTEQRETIRTWLSVTGWEAFCADTAAWPRAAE